MQTFFDIDFVAIGGSVLILAGVLWLITSGRLKPRYALLWLATACALLGVSIWRESIDLLGEVFGIAYKPALVFLAIDVFLMLILLHMSVVVSRMTDSIRTLAQDAALLRQQVEALTKE